MGNLSTERNLLIIFTVIVVVVTAVVVAIRDDGNEVGPAKKTVSVQRDQRAAQTNPIYRELSTPPNGLASLGRPRGKAGEYMFENRSATRGVSEVIYTDLAGAAAIDGNREPGSRITVRTETRSAADLRSAVKQLPRSKVLRTSLGVSAVVDPNGQLAVVALPKRRTLITVATPKRDQLRIALMRLTIG